MSSDKPRFQLMRTHPSGSSMATIEEVEAQLEKSSAADSPGCSYTIRICKPDELPPGFISCEPLARPIRDFVFKRDAELPAPLPTDDDELWAEMNRHRCELIDKRIARGGELPAEDEEVLRRLQIHADYYIQAVAPRPTAELEKLEAVIQRTPPKDALTTVFDLALQNVDCGNVICPDDDMCPDCQALQAVRPYTTYAAQPGDPTDIPVLWICSTCEETQEATQGDIAEAGAPWCADCDRAMELP